jgi:predicted lysophospholipase L1 biosynthesis ABC-type transport system permease subunit
MAHWSAIASLAWRESRNTRRKLLIYMSAISMGVAALVAIDSYSTNIRTSIDEQSRTLLGGDVAFRSRQDFPAKLDTILDSLQRGNVDVARVTNFASMAFAPGSGLTRLVQVRASSVSTAMATTTGTKMPDRTSANRCMGAFEPWASSTRRMMAASAVSLPTPVARHFSRPC